MLPSLWTPTRGGYYGVTRRFVKQLQGLGWESDGQGGFSDGYMIGSLMCFPPLSSTFGDYFAVLGMIRLLNSAVIERVLRPSTHSIILTYGIGEGSPLSVRTSRAMPSPTSLAHDSVRSVEHPMIVEITGFCIVLVQKTCVSNGVSIQL